MARSQRHRIENQGVHSDERLGTIPTVGTYNGSHLRPGATAGANLHTRAGAATAENGSGGAGTVVAGFVGVATTAGSPVAATGHVNGSIAPVYRRPAAGDAALPPPPP